MVFRVMKPSTTIATTIEIATTITWRKISIEYFELNYYKGLGLLFIELWELLKRAKPSVYAAKQ